MIFLFTFIAAFTNCWHDKVVELLINHPTFNSINEKDKNDQTALHKVEYLNIFK